MVRSTRLVAKLAIFASSSRNLTTDSRRSSDDQFERVGALAAGLVELSNGKEVLRQVADAQGEVSFDQLRPGKWVMRVYENNLPLYHVIETREVEVELKPGESRQMLIRILPKHRPIRFIDQGTITPRGRD